MHGEGCTFGVSTDSCEKKGRQSVEMIGTEEERRGKVSESMAVRIRTQKTDGRKDRYRGTSNEEGAGE